MNKNEVNKDKIVKSINKYLKNLYDNFKNDIVFLKKSVDESDIDIEDDNDVYVYVAYILNIDVVMHYHIDKDDAHLEYRFSKEKNIDKPHEVYDKNNKKVVECDIH